MSYKYDTPEAAYKEAQRRIKKAKGGFFRGEGSIELDLRNLGLTAVPPEITQLTNLTQLYLRKNPDLPIPPEIMAQAKNPQAILDYLREQQVEVARPLNEAKLILVGQGGVGKTSLVKWLLDNRFDPHEEQTKGIRIKKWPFSSP